ncbi:hypothetical protein IQ235_11655 [Oscillatoriales cyanobacterium LEGE 11467]|uniref:Uncharacterized protein n=1 Tax=Zarconia navalis LEGE 11467 TaxID=1828826 RepID=A0A928VWI5_9CYAN|nr:hypothetical protein [Zarconia navalis]MBE9041436.1 hypothetical protein [Zarconia navalis LEGE 11467]
MKLNLLPLVTGTLAIALSIAPVTVRAQSVGAAIDSEPDLMELANEMLMDNVNLTPQQSEILNPTLEQALDRVRELLTPEQVDRFYGALDAEEGLAEAIEALDMTPIQEVQIRNVLQATSLQVTPILTPQQRSQIEDNLEAHLDEDI